MTKQVECICGWKGTLDECETESHDPGGELTPDVVYLCPRDSDKHQSGILHTEGGKDVRL